MDQARHGRGVRGALLAAAAALAACASDLPTDSKQRDGFMGVLLPRPLGSVSMDREPIACTMGWAGIVLGGLVGGALSAGGGFDDRSAARSRKDAAVGALIGAFVGGLLFTPVGHLFQWFWDLLAGAGGGEDHGGYPP